MNKNNLQFLKKPIASGKSYGKVGCISYHNAMPNNN